MQRVVQSIPSSYTVWKDGTQAIAECNVKGGTDYTTGTDATVIQNAIDALTSGKILFRVGTYDIATPLSVIGTKRIVMVGEERRTTILKNVALTTQLIQCGNGVTDFTGDLTLDSLRLHGNDKDVALVKLLNTANHVAPRFLSCDFMAFGGKTTGTKYAVDSGNTYHFYDTLFFDCYFAFGKSAMRVLHSEQTFVNCTLGELTYGLEVQAGAVRVYGGLFTTNTEDIHIPNSTDLPLTQHFNGVWFENSANAVISSESSTNLQIVIDGCHLHSLNANWVLYFSSCTGKATILGGYLDTTGATGFAFGTMKVKSINFDGYVTENNGASAIASGQTHVHVTHGLGSATSTATPTKVRIMPTAKSTADPTFYVWVDTIGATEFIVNCTVDPGVLTLPFIWEAEI
jgi:hypothetical protein